MVVVKNLPTLSINPLPNTGGEILYDSTLNHPVINNASGFQKFVLSNLDNDVTIGRNLTVTGPILAIPTGNTAARPTSPTLGYIRYNSETSQFEGFGAGNSWGSLGGVTDVDQNTKILAEDGAGTNDNNLRFINNATETMRLTAGNLMGLGTTAPDKKLEINSSTGDCLRLTYNDSNGTAVNYTDILVSSGGNLSITPSGGDLDITTHNGTTQGLKLGGVLLTATATQLNDIVSGSGASSFNTAEITGNLTLTNHNGTTTGLILGSTLVTATASELNYVDTTEGTAEASKALVLDASRNITNINSLTSNILTLNGTTMPEFLSTWNTQTSIANKVWKSVTYSPRLNLYVAVSASSENTSSFATSTDRLTWTSRTAPASRAWNSVLWVPEHNLFVAVADASSSTTNSFAASSDGISWTGYAAPDLRNFTSVTYNKEDALFFVGLNNTTTSPAYRATSFINNTWVATSVTFTGIYSNFIYIPSLKIYATVRATPQTLSSLILEYRTSTFTSASYGTFPAPNTAKSWKSLAHSPELNITVAVASDTSSEVHSIGYAYSSNFSNWTLANASIAADWLKVIWAPELGMFLAISNDTTPKMMRSYNGINWTTISLPVNITQLTDISWFPESSTLILVSSVSSSAYAITFTSITSASALTFVTNPQSNLLKSSLNIGGVFNANAGIYGTFRWANILSTNELSNELMRLSVSGLSINQKRAAAAALEVRGTTINPNRIIRLTNNSTPSQYCDLDVNNGHLEIRQSTGGGIGILTNNNKGYLSVNNNGLVLDALNSSNVSIGTMVLGTLSVNKSFPSSRALEVNHVSGQCLRLSHNAPTDPAINFVDFLVNSSGHLTISPSGSTTTISSSNTIISSVTTISYGLTVQNNPSSFTNVADILVGSINPCLSISGGLAIAKSLSVTNDSYLGSVVLGSTEVAPIGTVAGLNTFASNTATALRSNIIYDSFDNIAMASTRSYISFSNNTSIAVSDGTVLTDYQTANNFVSNTTEDLNTVVSLGNGTFLFSLRMQNAGGQHTPVLVKGTKTSLTSVLWHQTPLQSDANAIILSMAAKDENSIVFITNNSKMYYTTNGSTFIENMSPPSNIDYNRSSNSTVIWASGFNMFLIGRTSGVSYSTNGSSWSSATGLPSTILKRIYYNPVLNKAFVYEPNSTIYNLYVTSDGINWSTVSLPSIGTNPRLGAFLNNVNNGGLVAIMPDKNSSVMTAIYSFNGIKWYITSVSDLFSVTPGNFDGFVRSQEIVVYQNNVASWIAWNGGWRIIKTGAIISPKPIFQLNTSSGYLINQSKTGYTWNRNSTDATTGTQIMSLDNTLNVAIPQTITDATDSTASNTGALIISGGVGIAKSVNINQQLTVTGTTTFSSTLNVTGNSTLTGNVGVGTSSPDKKVEINSSSGDCLRLTYNDSDGTATNYTDLLVTNDGALTITSSSGNVNISTHNGTTTGLQLNGTLVTSTAAELNYVDTTPGTAQASKALVLDANLEIIGIHNIETDNLTVNGTLVTSSAIELNYVDVTTIGVAQASKALVLDENLDIIGIHNIETDNLTVNGTLVTSSAIELNYVDVTAVGTAEASKALVLDASRNITNINELATTGLLSTIIANDNSSNVNYQTWTNDLATDMVTALQMNNVGLDFGTTSSHSLALITAGTERLSIDTSGNVDLINHDGSTVGLTLGGTLVTATATELNYVDVTTVGTAEASKALVLDASRNITNINEFSATILNATIHNATGNSITYPITINRTTSTTPANGLGAGIEFYIENSNNDNISFGSLEISADDITDNTEDGKFKINLMTNGSMTTALTLTKESLLVEELVETSDRRVKENIVSADLLDSYEKIMGLHIVNFNFIHDKEKRVHRGVIAQEVLEVIPGAVHIQQNADLDDFHSISTKELVGYMIGTIQHMNKKYTDLEEKYTDLEEKYNKLTKM